MTELHLEKLSRSYGTVAALSGVSLTLRAGEVHALMGENGAGKSTLIRLMAGLERPDAGAFLLNGQPVRFDTPAAPQETGLRFIHQELHVVPALSVAENMYLSRPYPRRMGLVDWGTLARNARDGLDRLGLSHIDPRVPMSRLGPGDQMLVRIAATLIGQDGVAPWLYVMDEPTAALTGVEAERLFAVIAELKAQGAGILYVSHRMAEVMRLSDRITVLRDGRHITTDERQATSEPALIHAMTGRDLSDLFPPRRVRFSAPPAGALRISSLSAPGIHGISVSLAKGEVLGIAGLSGSGRGALLQSLIGAIPRHAGQVSLDGKPYDPANPAEAWTAGIAYVPRERRSEGLMMQRSIVENVTLPHLGQIARAAWFQNRTAERGIVAEQGAAVRLKAHGPHQAADQLSGGNQQKVLFARAIAGRPKVLLLDEPTRGVDVGARFDIYRLIRELGEGGLSVIVASSDLQELVGLCDRIAVLQGGRLAHLIANDGLTEGDLLSLCYADTEKVPA